MTAAPRLLVIMGSGETAPTMVKTHHALLARTGGPTVLLDTPYGFQENADIISTRAVDYFRESVGERIEPAKWRSADAPAAERETTLARIAAAHYVFAGPGSPTYALRQWAGTPLPQLLADKLRQGGCVTFASTAALTLGLVTVPVYEIYKVGAPVEWSDGLDLLAVLGWRVAVIPHFDNAEGGNHDTRFCYLGERRLSVLEAALPDDAFVLGVDEHTACVLDLDVETATVAGNGVVTVRRHGASVTFASGSTVALDDLVHTEARTPSVRTEAGGAAPVDSAVPAAGMLADVERLEREFDAAASVRDVDGAVAAVLALDAAIVEWSRDTLQSDETDRARVILRRMVVGLADLARGSVDAATAVAPFVDALVAARARARDAGDFALADELRDRVVAAGVEVRDGADGTTWTYVGESA